MRLRHSLLFLVVLWPGLAFADNTRWWSEPDDSIVEVTKLLGGGTAYHESTRLTGNSKLLDVSACDPAVFSFNPDEDGAATGAEVNLWSLDARDGTTTNNGIKIQPDTDGDGLPNDVTYNGSTAKRTAIAFWAKQILIEAAANVNPDEFRVKIECK
jgi:hypothetical protein